MRLLGNTLAADEKYRVLNREKLTLPIQMQLSQKQKTFSESFPAFFKSSSSFQHFDKKDDPHRFLISEVPEFTCNSHAIISETQNLLPIFHCLFEI